MSNGRGQVTLVPGGAVSGSIRPPGSKSLTNRALVLAAIANGTSTIRGGLASEDTAVMIESLRRIGVTVHCDDAGTLTIEPNLWFENANGSATASSATATDLFIANSGTTVRFLTAMLAVAGGHYRLAGVPRMHQRPIGDLVDALKPAIDGEIVAETEGGCPPVMIHSRGLKHPAIRVGGHVSSQYLSGLMMAAAVSMRDEVEIQVVGELVSRPYVDMTATLMRQFDLQVTEPEMHRFRVAGRCTGQTVDIEPDASAASYFFAAAAITGGRVTVEGLNRDALQGDVAVVDVLERMGCQIEYQDHHITLIGGPLRGVDVDMNAISDTVQTVAPVALFARGSTRIRGVAHNRFKETDRIGDLARELRKFGGRIDEHDDGLTIHPISKPSANADESADHSTTRPIVIETYNDHRMAMGLSIVGLVRPNVTILNPACTGKTYPDFFHDLERLTGRSHHWGDVTTGSTA